MQATSASQTKVWTPRSLTRSELLLLQSDAAPAAAAASPALPAVTPLNLAGVRPRPRRSTARCPVLLTVPVACVVAVHCNAGAPLHGADEGELRAHVGRLGYKRRRRHAPQRV